MAMQVLGQLNLNKGKKRTAGFPKDQLALIAQYCPSFVRSSGEDGWLFQCPMQERFVPLHGVDTASSSHFGVSCIQMLNKEGHFVEFHLEDGQFTFLVNLVKQNQKQNSRFVGTSTSPSFFLGLVQAVAIAISTSARDNNGGKLLLTKGLRWNQ